MLRNLDWPAVIILAPYVLALRSTAILKNNIKNTEAFNLSSKITITLHAAAGLMISVLLIL
jgi:hypothetical protein